MEISGEKRSTSYLMQVIVMAIQRGNNEYCMHTVTGKSFSGALILASTNPQYDKRLFMVIP